MSRYSPSHSGKVMSPQYVSQMEVVGRDLLLTVRQVCGRKCVTPGLCDLHTETLEGIYHRNLVMESEMPVLGSSKAGCPCQPDIAVCIHRGMCHTGHGAVLETLRYGAFVLSAFLMFDSLNHLG